MLVCSVPSISGHAPHGACELKFVIRARERETGRHAPHGAWELKSAYIILRRLESIVTPRMGRVS